MSLPDLAATFLEIGGVERPKVMTSKSIWPTLKSDKQGLVDESRDHVLIGRERHVARARAGELPYPQRALRTKDFLFVINFKPERYPLGDHYGLDGAKEADVNQLTNNTFVTIPDEDAGPTKAWIVSNRKDPKVKFFFDHAYGKRPREELYDLRKDPHQMRNAAADLKYKDQVNKLRDQLMGGLSSTNDPRLIDGGKFFETAPMAGTIKEK